MNSGSKVFSNSFFYSFGAVLGKCLGLILLPVYTFYLSQEDYGIINLLLSFSSMLSYLVLLALDSALMRFYVDYKDFPETLRRLYGSLITVVVSCYAVTAAVIFLFRRSLEKTFFAGIPFFPYILISVLILGEGSTFALHRRYLETVQQGKKLTSVLLAEVFLTAGVAVSLLALFRLGAVGMLLATLSSSTFLVCFMIVDILRHKLAVFCFDVKLVKACFRYSLPLVPYAMSGYIGSFFSRFILQSFAGLNALGIFSVAMQITSAVEAVQDSAGHAYRPWLNETLKSHQPDMKREIGNTSKLLMCGYSVIYTLVGIFAMEVLSVMASPAFFYAWKVVVGTVMVFSVYSLIYFYMYQVLYYKDVSDKLFIVFVICNGILILATWLFVSLSGVWGIVIGMFLEANFRWLGMRYLLRKHEEIGYDVKYFLCCILGSWCAIILGVLPSWIQDIHGLSFFNLAYKILITAVFCALLLFFNRELIRSFGVREKAMQLLRQKTGIGKRSES